MHNGLIRTLIQKFISDKLTIAGSKNAHKSVSEEAKVSSKKLGRTANGGIIRHRKSEWIVEASLAGNHIRSCLLETMSFVVPKTTKTTRTRG